MRLRPIVHGRRRYHRMSAIIFMVLVIVSFGSALLGQASAGVWGSLGPYTGYFSGEYKPTYHVEPYCTAKSCPDPSDGNDVLPPGVVSCPKADDRALPYCIDTVDKLITLLRNDNNRAPTTREHASSAFIFWTLLGKGPTYANKNGGRDIPGNYTIPNVPGSGFTALENLINAELADGQISVDWNHNYSPKDGLTPRTYSMWVYDRNRADVAQDPGNGRQDGEAIVFTDNSTHQRIYALFRACANPGGELQGLPPLKLKWSLTRTSTVTNPTTGVTRGSGDVTVAPGDTVIFRHTVTNNGPGQATYAWQVRGDYTTSSGSSTGWGGYRYGLNQLSSCNDPPNPLPNGTANSVDPGDNRPDQVTCRYEFPNGADQGTKYCQRIASGNFSNPNDASGGSGESTPVCAVLGPSPSPGPGLTCINLRTDPAPVQPGDTIKSVTVNIRYSGGAPDYTGMRLVIPSPFAPPYNATVAVSKTGTDLSAKFGPMTTPAATADNYPLTWDLMDGATVVKSCPGSLSTSGLPYFSVYGANVSSGGDFEDAGDQCANAPGDGTISSWYNANTDFAGASTILSAIALGQITGFGSAEARTGPSPPDPVHPTGLTFASTGKGVIVDNNAQTPKLGGKFDGTASSGASCFFKAAPPVGTPDATHPVASVDVSGLAGKAHNYKGDVTLDGGTGIAAGKNVSVFVHGNVYIKSDIFFANPNTPGNWTINAITDTTNIPSFILKVTGGNIYVADTVTQLDGIYVAEQDVKTGKGGIIYTCGSAYAPDTSVNLFGCNEQLTINGSFVADQVNLMRTFGTLRNASSTENPNGPSKACADGPKAAVCAGEVFNFSPEVYLSSPAILQPTSSAPGFNAITSLPPVL